MNGTVAIEYLDHLCVAHLTGDIDLANAERIERAIVTSFDEERMRGLVVDLSAVTFLDSAGIRMLFGLHAALSGRGRSLAAVVPADAPFRRVLAITGIPDTLATATTVTDAVDLLLRDR